MSDEKPWRETTVGKPPWVMWQEWADGWHDGWDARRLYALCARVWREAYQAGEQRADRLAAALREYGETDDFGRWHEFGCIEDFTDFETGEPLSRCSRARAALADSPKEETCWCGHGLSRHKENWPDGICFDCWPGKPHLYNLAVADSPKEVNDGAHSA